MRVNVQSGLVEERRGDRRKECTGCTAQGDPVLNMKAKVIKHTHTHTDTHMTHTHNTYTNKCI